MAVRLPDSPPPGYSSKISSPGLRWWGRYLGLTRPMSSKGLLVLGGLATFVLAACALATPEAVDFAATLPDAALEHVQDRLGPGLDHLLGGHRRYRSAIHSAEPGMELEEVPAQPPAPSSTVLEPCPDVYALPGGYLVPPPKGAPLPQTTYRIPVQRSDSSAAFEAPSWSSRLMKQSEERKARKAEQEGQGKEYADTKEEGWGDLEWMRDQTVLMIGDSLDRNGVFHLGTQLASAGFRHKFLTSETTKDHPLPRYPNTPSHLIGVAHHASLNLTVSNWFLMSIVASGPETVNEQESWFHPGEDMPQYFIPRLEQLYLPSVTAGALPSPSVVVIYSALWDLAWSGYKRSAQHAPPIPQAGAPLDPEDVERHQRRFVQLADWVKTHFPKARVVFRTVHETTEKADHNVMSRTRIRQLAQSTMDLFNEGKLKVDDVMRWGEKVKGREEEMEDGVVHFGVGSAQWLYHDMLLDQLRRHVVGPEVSQWSECRDYRLVSSPPAKPRLGAKVRQDDRVVDAGRPGQRNARKRAI